MNSRRRDLRAQFVHALGRKTAHRQVLPHNENSYDDRKGEAGNQPPVGRRQEAQRSPWPPLVRPDDDRHCAEHPLPEHPAPIGVSSRVGDAGGNLALETSVEVGGLEARDDDGEEDGEDDVE